MKLVVSASHLMMEDVRCLESVTGHKIASFPGLSEMQPQQRAAFDKATETADLTLFAVQAADRSCLDSIQRKNPGRPSALWLLDSRRNGVLNPRLLATFTHRFVADQSFVQLNTPEPSWLPGCCWRLSRSELLSLLAKPSACTSAQPTIWLPASLDRAGRLRYLEPELKRRISKCGCSVETRPASPGLEFGRALQSTPIVINFGDEDPTDLHLFEAWGLNRVVMVSRTAEIERMSIAPDSTVLFDPDLLDFAERLEEAVLRSQRPVSTASLVANQHLLVHRLVEILNVCLDQSYLIPEALTGSDTNVGSTPALHGQSYASSVQPRVSSAPVDNGSRGNIGMVLLANRSIPAAPLVASTCLQVADGSKDRICVRLRNLRVQFTTRDFLAIADTCAEVLERCSGTHNAEDRPDAVPESNNGATTQSDRQHSPVSDVSLKHTQTEVVTDSPEPATLSLSPESARFVQRAQAALDAKDSSGAIAALEQARRLSPKHPQVLTALGNLYFQCNRFAEARTVLSAAQQADPQDPLLPVLLAHVCYRLKDRRGFRNGLKRALELDPANAPALQLQADANLDSGNYADAARDYGLLVEQGVADLNVMLALGQCFTHMQRWEGAQACFEQALLQDPSNAVAQRNLVKLQRRVQTSSKLVEQTLPRRC